MSPQPYLVTAAVLVIGLGAFHSVMGEIYIVRRLLRRDNLPKLFGGDTFTKRTIRYAWHLLTIFATAIGGILFAFSSTGESSLRVIAAILGWSFVAATVWGLASTRGRHLSWLVFLALAILTFAAA